MRRRFFKSRLIYLILKIVCQTLLLSSIKLDHSQIVDLPKSALAFASGLYADMNLNRKIVSKIIDDVKTQLIDVLCELVNFVA